MVGDDLHRSQHANETGQVARLTMKTHALLNTVAAISILALSAKAEDASALLENRALRAEVNLSSGEVTLLDRQTGVGWELGVPEVVLKTGGKGALSPMRVVQRDRKTLRYRREGIGEFTLSLLADPARVEYSAVPEGDIKELRLLRKTLPVGPGDNSYYAAPYRMGIQLRAEGDKPFNRRFRNECSVDVIQREHAPCFPRRVWGSESNRTVEAARRDSP